MRGSRHVAEADQGHVPGETGQRPKSSSRRMSRSGGPWRHRSRTMETGRVASGRGDTQMRHPRALPLVNRRCRQCCDKRPPAGRVHALLGVDVDLIRTPDHCPRSRQRTGRRPDVPTPDRSCRRFRCRWRKGVARPETGAPCRVVVSSRRRPRPELTSFL